MRSAHERILALMDDYGLQDLRALAAVVQGRSEKAMRDAIRALPDGIYTSTITNNPLGTPMTFPVALTVAGRRDRRRFCRRAAAKCPRAA